MRYPNELKEEARLAIRRNWTLVLGSTGHMKWYDPEGVLRLVTSMTPSKGKRGVLNARSELKKAGIER